MPPPVAKRYPNSRYAASLEGFSGSHIGGRSLGQDLEQDAPRYEPVVVDEKAEDEAERERETSPDLQDPMVHHFSARCGFLKMRTRRQQQRDQLLTARRISISSDQDHLMA